MNKSFDPEKIEAIFRLVSNVRENIRDGALNVSMANLVKALQLYLSTPLLKKEKEILEIDFYDLQIKISQHPKFGATYGPVSFRQGEHEENIEFMLQLIKFGAENIQEQLEQGLELLNGGRYDEAWKIFVEVMGNPDAELEHFIAIGDAYLKNKRWPEAQEVFARAMERDPESLHLLNRMAISYRKDEKYEEALSTYRKAVKLSPLDEGLYYNVARLFLDMGRRKNAVQALRKALSINPKFQRAAKMLTEVQHTSSEPKPAPQEVG